MSVHQRKNEMITIGEYLDFCQSISDIIEKVALLQAETSSVMISTEELADTGSFVERLRKKVLGNIIDIKPTGFAPFYQEEDEAVEILE